MSNPYDKAFAVLDERDALRIDLAREKERADRATKDLADLTAERENYRANYKDAVDESWEFAEQNDALRDRVAQLEEALGGIAVGDHEGCSNHGPLEKCPAIGCQHIAALLSPSSAPQWRVEIERAAFERAAQVADTEAACHRLNNRGTSDLAASDVAAAIRALASGPAQPTKKDGEK